MSSNEARQFWSFGHQSIRLVDREPIEDEFFKGEEEEDGPSGRTDSLVREAIQNSMDAREGADPSEVRFAFSLAEQHASPDVAKHFLSELLPHLRASEGEFLKTITALPKMPFLVVEDFGTVGLSGDPARRQPPVTDDQRDPQHFYWFWWRVGKSGKKGTNRGRWGLGRSVFAATSRIRTFFALTKRATDGVKLLMGQAKLGSHSVGNEHFVPEGFFHDVGANEQVQIPFSSARNGAEIEEFERRFHLHRKNRNGLSIVVPYPTENLTAKEVIRSVIVHYFYPILRGDLRVEVVGPDQEATILTTQSIRQVAGGLSWNGGRRKEKKHVQPPFDMADWAIDQQSKQMAFTLPLAGRDRVPNWNEPFIGTDLLTAMRDHYENNGRISVRVPMTVEKKSGLVETYFDVFLTADSTIEKGEDHFIREGMTISGISTLAGHRGVRGIAVVVEPTLSTLLGDSEGPAHQDWSSGETRPNKDFVKWIKRVSFVKNSLVRLLGILSPVPEGLDENLLLDIFSIDAPAGPKRRRKRKKATGPGPVEPPVVPPLPDPPKEFLVVQTKGGFRVRSDGALGLVGRRISVKVAYDVASGSPLSAYSRFDFVLTEGAKSPIKFSNRGAKLDNREQNTFEIVIQADDFEVGLEGFDTERGDLYVKAALAPERSDINDSTI